MTSPALGRGNAYYVISRGHTKLVFDELKVNSKIRNVKKLATHTFNIIAIF